MIFGFNTDVKQGDTVYHVQSEARENELILQTQVFVRGRCIGKRATSYAERISEGGFTDQQKEQILREQHRLVLDSIREERLEAVLDRRETAEVLATVKELDLQWINADSVHANGKSRRLEPQCPARASPSASPVRMLRLSTRRLLPTPVDRPR